MLTVDPHPLLELRAFVTVFPRPLRDMPSPPVLRGLLAPDAKAPDAPKEQHPVVQHRIVRHRSPSLASSHGLGGMKAEAADIAP